MSEAAFLPLPICWQYPTSKPAECEVTAVTVDLTDAQLDQIECLLPSLIKLELAA